MMTKSRLLMPLIGALLLGAMPYAQAQKYPDRPITMIVPFPAGGLTDVPARVAATMMSEKLGQNVVVENKTGATGTIGAAFAARANPDGYTLFANSAAPARSAPPSPRAQIRTATPCSRTRRPTRRTCTSRS